MKNRIPPPIILLVAGIAMWFVAQSPFALAVPIPFAAGIAIVVAVTGGGVSIVAIRKFAAVETTVNPLHPDDATSLVDSGIFGVTRNPMYLGLTLILAGWMVWLQSAANIVILAAFVIVMTELQIKPEEAALQKLFGQRFNDYCGRTRRWL